MAVSDARRLQSIHSSPVGSLGPTDQNEDSTEGIPCLIQSVSVRTCWTLCGVGKLLLSRTCSRRRTSR